jgi:hypothetical protein
VKKTLLAAAVVISGLMLVVQTAGARPASQAPGCPSPHWFSGLVAAGLCGENNSNGGGDSAGNSGGNNGGGNSGGSQQYPCGPTQVQWSNWSLGTGDDESCVDALVMQNTCTGSARLIRTTGNAHACGDEDVLPPATNPCSISGTYDNSGFSVACNGRWECVAAVPLPPTYIDVRPYPVTLVRWPTAIRCSGQGTSSDSCLVSDAGEMRNLRLTLEFRPATGVVTVTLPYLPTFTFNASSPTSQPTLFKWEVPSHPAAGGDVLAGTLGGFFDEIPGDFPVFMGHMKTPYRLYWTVSFERNEYGNWVGYSFNGELMPQDVRDLPPSLIADLNGDGAGDAYWDPNFVISRMDENNRTDNPLYERHWSYGERLPWAAREGQGQVGWPGVP